MSKSRLPSNPVQLPSFEFGDNSSGLPSSASGQRPGASANIPTGNPNTPGMTRAALAERRDVYGTEPARVPSPGAGGQLSSSFSDDLGKAFDNVALAHSRPQTVVDPSSTNGSALAVPSAATQQQQPRETFAASGQLADSSRDAASSTAKPPAAPRALTPDPTSDVQAVSLDPDTTVFFIDDGVTFPDETPAATHTTTGRSLEGALVGVSDGAAAHGGPHVDAQLQGTRVPASAPAGGAGDAAVTGAAIAVAAGAVAAGASEAKAPDFSGREAQVPAPAHAFPGTETPSSGGPPFPTGTPKSTDTPKSSVGFADATRGDSNVPTFREPELAADGSERPPLSVGAMAAGGAVAGGAAAASALKVASDTERGAERAVSSASVTAIIGGKEGRPNDREPVSPQVERPTTPSGLSTHSTLEAPGSPAGSSTPLRNPDSAGQPNTMRGNEAAASTTSITAIRSGTEGMSPAGSPTQYPSNKVKTGVMAAIPAVSSPLSGSFSPNEEAPLPTTAAVGDPAVSDHPATSREVGSYPEPQHDGPHETTHALNVGDMDTSDSGAAEPTASPESTPFQTPAASSTPVRASATPDGTSASGVAGVAGVAGAGVAAAGHKAHHASYANDDEEAKAIADKMSPEEAAAFQGKDHKTSYSNPEELGAVAGAATSADPREAAFNAEENHGRQSSVGAAALPAGAAAAKPPTSSSKVSQNPASPMPAATAATSGNGNGPFGKSGATHTAATKASPAANHQRTASSSSSASRRKVGLLSKLKGEMKMLSGKISHDDKKVAEGERLKGGE